MLLITQFLLTSLYNVFRFFAVMVWGYLGWLYMFYIILYLCHFQWNNKEDAVALKSLGQWMSFDSFCVPFKIINLMQTHFESFSLFIPNWWHSMCKTSLCICWVRITCYIFIANNITYSALTFVHTT